MREIDISAGKERIASEPGDELQGQIQRALNAGDWSNADAALIELWKAQPTSSTASYVVSRYERLKPHLRLSQCRLFILRSFTLEPTLPLLRAAAFVNRIDLSVQISDFNAYVQALLNPGSDLYSFGPEIVILAVQTRDIAPDLWENFESLSPDQVTAAIDRVIKSVRGWIHEFRARSQASLVLHSFEVPPIPNKGILDGQSEGGQVAAIRRINFELLRLVRDYSGVYILDYDGLVARHGRESWHDEKKWLTMRSPIAAKYLIHVANEWLRFIHPLTSRICKALVVDLDNTLWGGVVGEDGPHGIKLGPEYPGAAYQSLQRTILSLHERGIILAVNSKNNQSDAMEVIEHHPGMLLRPHHFAALRINWNDKAQNLREIAAELGIGTDALAFLDDNPAERQWIRSQVPETVVIDLPVDPIGYASALKESPVFERLTISAEDHARASYYSAQRLRTALEQSTDSVEEFYLSLSMEAEVSLVTPETLVRVAQLTQKTNQFNLTTRRRTEQEIAKLADDPDWQIYSMRVRDRFGDNGVVGVAMAQHSGPVCRIDTFLLSCRVIGRTLETTLLAAVAEQARLRGANRLVGSFLPTKKNAPARDFYKSHGFSCTLNGSSESIWEFDLARDTIASPRWVTVKFQ